MDYKVIPSNSAKTSPLITHFFTVSSDRSVIEDKSMVPSGRQYILFYLKGSVRHETGDVQLLCENNVSFVHIHDVCYSSYIAADSFVLGVSMAPNAIYQLFGKEYKKNAPFISDSRAYLGNDELHDLCSVLREQSSLTEQITLLENYFDLKMKNVRSGDLVDQFLKLMGTFDNDLSTEEISRHLFINKRSLELKFHAITGITPGKYIKLMRFVNFFSDFNNKVCSINELILKYNYTDYSHLSRDFKKYTGTSLKDSKMYPDSLYNAYMAALGNKKKG